MFCFQCQEAAKGIGCSIAGVCGKKDDVAQMQDLLMYSSKGMAWWMNEAEKQGISNQANYHAMLLTNLFTTITNANFDKEALLSRVSETLEIQRKLKNQLKEKVTGVIPEAANWDATSIEEMERRALAIGIMSETNEDIRSLRELATYGLKGVAAYAEHAMNLGYTDSELDKFVASTLAELLRDDLSVDQWVALVMKTGEFAVRTMALLDKANTESYGNPEISKVNIGVRNNPAILISGHDLRDLEDLLEQTQGTGVDVYTHSEMLPAHYYPKFKQYSNFVGNYGSSWWKQTEDFTTFNGPILFTTNCIVPPHSNANYTDRIYTTGAAGLSGAIHISDRVNGGRKDFSVIIEHAKRCAAPTEIETGEIIGGFAHAQVLALADKVVEAVKSGAIRKFVVMAGCDGRMKSREYYTEFAKKLPTDTVILTAGCAKYRYNKIALGDIGGIPRVLDAGQCNDSYSLAIIAMKLKDVFGLDDINKLPIVYNIAWYEQKAVTVLLALLSLGVKNIHLGPTLPAFLSPNVAKVLVDNFGIAGISTVDEDMKIMIG
jgi:hydroxylamine reductase